MESWPPSPSLSLRSSHASPVPKDTRLSLAALSTLGKASKGGRRGRGKKGGRQARAAPGLQFTTPLFHGKMEHSAPSARKGEVGRTLRSRLGAATRTQRPESGTPGTALRESQPLGEPPRRLRAAAEPMPARVGSRGRQSAYRSQVRGRGVTGRRGAGSGGASPRRGRRAACRVCGKEPGVTRGPGEEPTGPRSPVGNARTQLSWGPRLPADGPGPAWRRGGRALWTRGGASRRAL